MKRLLLSTALVAATCAPVYAQNAEEMFRQQADPQELHASNFIGMRVYRTDTLDAEAYEGIQDGWDDIGEINDVIISRDGNVEAVLVDIGGFLGIGENQVAVDMDSITFVADSGTPDQEADFFLILNAPRGALEEAPIYGSAAAMSGDEDMASASGGSDMSDAGAESTADAGDATASEDAEEMTASSEDTTADDAMPTHTSDANAPSTQMGTGTGLSREGYVTATDEHLTAETLTGASAYDANDEWIGEVSRLLMTDEGKIDAAIVDVGGFLGLGEKPVQLELSKLDILRPEKGGDLRVYISMSEDELESLPEFEN